MNPPSVRVFSIPLTPPIAKPAPAPPPSPSPTVIPDTTPVQSNILFPGSNPTQVHAVPNWKWDRIKDPLPPDGVIGSTRHEEGPFNQEYFRKDLEREAVLNVDFYYQFVKEVAGLVGQGTTADQFWKSTEAGGRAIETIISNLNLERIDRPWTDEETRARLAAIRTDLLTANDQAKDISAVKAFKDPQTQRLASLIQLAPQLGVINRLEGMAIPKEQIEALLQAVSSPSTTTTPSLITEAERRDYQDKIDRYGSIAEYYNAETKVIQEEALNEEMKVLILLNAQLQKDYLASRDKLSFIRLDQRMANVDKNITQALERIQGNLSVKFKNIQDRVAKLMQIQNLIEKQRQQQQQQQQTSASSQLPVQPPSDNIRLTDGSYLENVNDPSLMLLKLMFRPNKTISESELKAWDALYYGGKYFATIKASTSNNDAKSVKEKLELIRLVDQMLRSSEDPGVAWRKSPHNFGMIFLTDNFQSALNMAYERVRKPCKKEWVHLIDLMTHDQVHTWFAKLVSLEIAEQSYMFPGRYVLYCLFIV
jgi:hypothetical protein